jgi:hypothetical protein
MKSASLVLPGLAAALALGSCDKPKNRPPPPPPSVAMPQAAARQGPPMPALPAWSAALMGKPIQTLYPGEHPVCLGNTDNVQTKYGGATPGVQIVGWGWDTAAKAPIGRVLLADMNGLVAGAGETGMERRDVPAAIAAVTSPRSGWAAYTSQVTGPVDAYGLIEGGRAVCRLGHLEF